MYVCSKLKVIVQRTSTKGFQSLINRDLAKRDSLLRDLAKSAPHRTITNHNLLTRIVAVKCNNIKNAIQ